MYNDSDYERLSKAIVNDYVVDASENLQTRITKVAQDMQLNPDEARRLLEKTNALAHLTLFNKRAADEDRYVTFAVADPAVLMSELYGQRPLPADDSGLKVAYDVRDYADLVPDERTYDDDLSWANEKTADINESAISPANVAMRLQRAVDALAQEAAIKEAGMEDAIASLIEQSHYHVTPEKLASRILSCHGGDSVAVLTRMVNAGFLTGQEKVATIHDSRPQRFDSLISQAVRASKDYAAALEEYTLATSYLSQR